MSERVCLGRRIHLLAVAAVTVLACAACSTPRVQPIATTPPDSPNPNQVQGGFNPNPGNSYNSTASQSLDLKDRVPETDQQRRARLHMELAVGYYQDGKYSVALDELRESLSDDPNFAEALDVLGLVYMELHDKDLAEQSFKRALALSPNDSNILNNYGWFLCQNGQAAESISYFTKAVQNPLYNRPARPLQNAGVCSLRAGNEKAAEEYFKRSFQLDPSGPVSALNLAEIFYRQHQVERADFYANLVNRTAAANPESLWLGVRIAHELRNTPEELSLATKLRNDFPGSHEAELLARQAYNE